MQPLPKQLFPYNTKKQFVCEFAGCGKTLSRNEHLKTHMHTHTGETPFVCKFLGCGKAFTQSGNLNRHMRTHSGENPFICEFDGCSSTFTERGTLRKHMRAHTSEKPFICVFEGCVAAFHQSGALKTHMRTHTGERPFPCEFEGCGASFSTGGNLQNHKRIHTGDRPFSCEYEGCGAAFTEGGSLKTHMRTHTGERPFPCEFEGCGASFTIGGNLKQHVFYWHTQVGNVRLKKAESRILSLLQNHNIPFKEQHLIDFRCVGEDREGDRCYIDFLIDIKNDLDETTGFVFLEVDEDQHLHYSVSCEVRRMADVYRTLALEGNTMPIAFVRYNPDAHRSNDKLVRVLKRDREKTLVEMLKSWKFDRPFGVYYMYYNKIDNEPAIFENVEYDTRFKDYYIGCI